MALVEHYTMTEDERLRMQRLKTDIDALELFIGSGGDAVRDTDVTRLAGKYREAEEFKRRLMIENMEVAVDEGAYEYTFYFDSVLGYVFASEIDE